MKVRDIIHYLYGYVVIEDRYEVNALYEFSQGYVGNVPSEIMEANVDKVYAEDDKLFVTTDL